MKERLGNWQNATSAVISNKNCGNRFHHGRCGRFPAGGLSFQLNSSPIQNTIDSSKKV